MIRLVIYEDNTEFRDALKEILDKSGHFEIAGAFPSCDEIEFHIPKMKPDVVLMDIEMPGKDGIAGLKYLQKNHPKVKTLMLTWINDDDKIQQCLKLGAAGYILKDHSDDHEAIDKILKVYKNLKEDVIAVYQGESPISPSIMAKVMKKFRSLISGDDKVSSKEDFPWDFNDGELAFLFGVYYALSYIQIARAYTRSKDAIGSYQKSINDKTGMDVRDVARRVALHYGSFFFPKMLAERTLAQDKYYEFSITEKKILELSSQGKSIAEIAKSINTTQSGVESAIEAIYGKLRKSV